MKELNNIYYPRTIPEVRDMIKDPNIHLDCTGCNNCRPDNIVPCAKGMEGMGEIGIGVVCMEKKVQITGIRNEQNTLPVDDEGSEMIPNEIIELPQHGNNAAD